MKIKLLLVPIILLFLSCQEQAKEYVKIEGTIFGTYYHIIYQPTQNADLLQPISEALNAVDWSLSTYKDTSTISSFNKSASGIEIDSLMKVVYLAGEDVYKHSNGAFDMTVGALVNEWGFGFKKRDNITDEKIQDLLSHVGMHQVSLKDNFLSKTDTAIKLDAAAIAKGFGVDVVANALKDYGISNYMVEIGGEISVGGVNTKGVKWRVGIDKPIDDKLASSRPLQDIISISEVALATSGNYRNFYIEDGKKYAHTISPFTGYPVQHSLLSASIIAPNCMLADAYATACMVMGVEESMQMIENLSDIEAYFIYADADGNNQVKYTSGFEEYIVK
ncbi:FAD:protein FMN transferase [Saccharicrinis aurantiacus]|uniref:FAD:protein FMN transferase n=1 Tax=Saccharicrinis aurantiacus TaxID=1849719 RepID=UPI00094F9F89|nr:FAD:protein FMN transferase [Saccharicrinis aurantiacus]